MVDHLPYSRTSELAHRPRHDGIKNCRWDPHTRNRTWRIHLFMAVNHMVDAEGLGGRLAQPAWGGRNPAFPCTMTGSRDSTCKSTPSERGVQNE